MHNDDDIRQVLVRLFPTSDKADLVAQDAGLPESTMPLNPSTIEIYWSKIWKEAKRGNKELPLIERALKDYPNDQELIQIRAHLTSMQTKKLPPEALDGFVQGPPDKNIIKPQN